MCKGLAIGGPYFFSLVAHRGSKIDTFWSQKTMKIEVTERPSSKFGLKGVRAGSRARQGGAATAHLNVEQREFPKC